MAKQDTLCYKPRDLGDKGAWLVLDSCQVPVDMLYIAESVNVLVEAESEKRVQNEPSHFTLCSLELIEELDGIAHLLVIEQLLEVWLERQQCFKHEVDLLQCYDC